MDDRYYYGWPRKEHVKQAVPTTNHVPPKARPTDEN